MKKLSVFLTAMVTAVASVASNPMLAVSSYPSVNAVQAVNQENDIATAIVTRADASLAFFNSDNSRSAFQS